jgi:hypothetical protein
VHAVGGSAVIVRLQSGLIACCVEPAFRDFFLWEFWGFSRKNTKNGEICHKEIKKCVKMALFTRKMALLKQRTPQVAGFPVQTNGHFVMNHIIT